MANFGDACTPERLVGLYREMDRALLLAASGPDTVAAVTQLAVAAVPGVEQASISEGCEGRFRTLASTGEVALRGDKISMNWDMGRAWTP